MSRISPILTIAFIVFIIFHPYFLEGLIPINADWLIANFLPWGSQASHIKVHNPDLDDSILQYYPFRLLVQEQWKKGIVPLWNPFILCGAPLLANGLSNPFDPMHLFSIFLPPEITWTWTIILYLFMAGVFMYFLCRNFKLGKIPSLLSASLYIVNAFTLCRLEYPYTLAVLAWFPLVLALLKKSLDNDNLKINIAAGLILGILFLSGHLQYSLFFFLFLLCLCLYFLFANKNKIRIFQKTIIIIVLGLLIGSIQLLPSLELYHQSQRANIPRYFGQNFIYPSSLIINILPNFLGTPYDNTYYGIFIYKLSYFNLPNFYMGVIPLILVAGLFLCRKSNAFDKFLLVITFLPFTFLLLCSFKTFHQWIWKLNFHLSFMDLSRIKGIVVFCLCFLAGKGIEELLYNRQNGANLRKFAIFAIIIFLSLLIVAEIAFHLIPAKLQMQINPNTLLKYCLERLKFRGSVFFYHRTIPPILIMLVFCGIIFLFEKRGGNLRFAGLITFLLLIIDPIKANLPYSPFVSSEQIFPLTESTKFLKTIEGIFRIGGVDVPGGDPFKGDIYPPNTTIPYFLQDVRGWESIYPDNYQDFSSILTGKESSWVTTLKEAYHPLYDLINLKYILTTQVVEHPPLKLVFNNELNIYENLSAFPRFFWFDESGQIEKETIKVNLYSPTRIEVEAFTRREREMVASETLYPGWSAFIDGKPVKINKRLFFMRSIKIPPGNHKIEFIFSPFSFKIALFFCLCAIYVAIFLSIKITLTANIEKIF